MTDSIASFCAVISKWKDISWLVNRTNFFDTDDTEKSNNITGWPMRWICCV